MFSIRSCSFEWIQYGEVDREIHEHDVVAGDHCSKESDGAIDEFVTSVRLLERGGTEQYGRS